MGPVTATIKRGKDVMDPKCELLSIDIIHEVNRIPAAELVLLDGIPARREFPISDSGFFAPGNELEILLRHGDDPDAGVFKGLVVRQTIEAGADRSLLRVRLKDAAIRLTGARRSAVYRDQTDADVIGKIVDEAKLAKGKIDVTQPKLPEIVQFDATDWDFILSRAEVHGLVVVAEAGKLSVLELDLSGEAVHQLEYGLSELYDFEIEVDAGHQYAAVEGVAWDLKKQESTKVAKGTEFPLAQGDLAGDKLAGKLGFATHHLSHAVPLDPEELQAWADASLARSRMAMLRGRLSCPGSGGVALLEPIEVKSFGGHYSGKTLVTGIRHRVDVDGWRTDVQFGLSPRRFCRTPGIQAPRAGGLLPPVGGLQIGVVEPFEEDPAGEHRVKVKIPGIDPDKGFLWARLASPDAGLERGWYFLPEPGDEVVVGFFNGDPRQPVVLGSLYGSKNKPAPALAPPSDKNTDKGVFTKKGSALHFVDADKPSVCLETAAGNRLLLDEEQESVQLSDAQGNTITMSKDGIEIKCAKDLKIEASGNVEIKGTKVDVK